MVGHCLPDLPSSIQAYATRTLPTGTSVRPKSKAHAPKPNDGKCKRAESKSAGADAVTVQPKPKKGKHIAADQGNIPATTNQTSQGEKTRATHGRQSKRDTDAAIGLSRPLAASDELSESEVFLAQALMATIESKKTVAQIAPQPATSSSQRHVPVQPQETVEGEHSDSSLSSPESGDVPLHSSEEDNSGSGDNLEDDVDDDEFVATFDAELESARAHHWISIVCFLVGGHPIDYEFEKQRGEEGNGDVLATQKGKRWENKAQTSALNDRQLLERVLTIYASSSPHLDTFLGRKHCSKVRAIGRPTVAVLAAPHTANSTPNTPSFAVVPAPSLPHQGPIGTPKSPSTAVVQGFAYTPPVPGASQDAHQTLLTQIIPAHPPPNTNHLAPDFYTLATAVPGGTVLLNPQHLHIRTIVKTSFLRLNVCLVVENAFPDQLAAARFISTALVEASQAHEYLGLTQRLRNDEDFLSRLVILTKQHISPFRLAVTKEADSNAAAQYTLVASATTPDRIATLTKWLVYIYPFTEPEGKLTIPWNKPYMHECIVVVLRNTFFVGPRCSHTRSPEIFTSTLPQCADERKVPMVILALVGTAIHAALCARRAGFFDPQSFSADAFVDAYNKHITLLTEIKSQNARGYHTMMHRLFTRAGNAVTPIVDPMPQNALAHVDFAKMEID
ncbi:hypothetical protein BD309DRAFT_983577 [Dichomitus squalens]|nr:hypothetical protein BD309DRAFT_983577 [Dichomitus squalens]